MVFSRRPIAIVPLLCGLLLNAATDAVGAPDARPDAAVLGRIDGLFDQAMRENYHSRGIDLMESCLSACEAALAESPGNYDLLWRAARAAMELAECERIQNAPDWMERSRALLPVALTRADAALTAKPTGVEAYFWELQIIGLVQEADGIPALVSRGLAPKVRRDIDACKTIDPAYLDYSILLADAVYYSSLPPLWGRDTEKALRLYGEFEVRTTWTFEPYRQYLKAAELLIATKRPENVGRARALLTRSLAMPDQRPYYRMLTEKFLAGLSGSDGAAGPGS